MEQVLNNVLNAVHITQGINKIDVLGFDYPVDITVQVFEDEMLVRCNHATTHLEEEFIDDFNYHRVEVCDKKNCQAARVLGGDWDE